MIVFEIFFLVYFGFAVVHTFLFAIAGNFKLRKINTKTIAESRIAVFIPAYKEDQVIISTVLHALEQTYPAIRFSIIVIADGLQSDTLTALSLMPIKVVQVKFDKSTKAKSLNYAMAKVTESYDIAVVLDADNIMEVDFLAKINAAFNAGYVAIQGQRVAKNMNTSFAILDAVSEAINNHIYRKGHTILGLSSALIGSGMAFDYNLFKATLKNNKAVGGFDRDLQLAFIGRKQRILYLEDAVVYDEKVEKSSTFSNQRKRWIASQFIYLQRNFVTGIKHLFTGNYDYFHMAIVNNILLPRMLMLGLITVCTFCAILFKAYLQLPYYYWILLFACYLLTFLLSIPLKLYNKKLFISLLSIPQAFIILFISLFRLKGADRKFIHTPHSNVEVDKSLIKN